MRTQYKNGMALATPELGCDGCDVVVLQGVLCHESGCPEAWKDRQKRCGICGGEFYGDSKCQAVCEDCRREVTE